MPSYSTVVLTNLSTGLPFTFEVPRETLDYFERQLRMIKKGEAPMLGNPYQLTRTYELSMFPSSKKLSEIFFENGFNGKLLTQILQEFGVEDKVFIEKLLADEDYISIIRPWFEGISGDGERAAATLWVVYNETKSFYSVKV